MRVLVRYVLISLVVVAVAYGLFVQRVGKRTPFGHAYVFFKKDAPGVLESIQGGLDERLRELREETDEDEAATRKVKEDARPIREKKAARRDADKREERRSGRREDGRREDGRREAPAREAAAREAPTRERRGSEEPARAAARDGSRRDVERTALARRDEPTRPDPLRAAREPDRDRAPAEGRGPAAREPSREREPEVRAPVTTPRDDGRGRRDEVRAATRREPAGREPAGREPAARSNAAASSETPSRAATRAPAGPASSASRAATAPATVARAAAPAPRGDLEAASAHDARAAREESERRVARLREAKLAADLERARREREAVPPPRRRTEVERDIAPQSREALDGIVRRR